MVFLLVSQQRTRSAHLASNDRFDPPIQEQNVRDSARLSALCSGVQFLFQAFELLRYVDYVYIYIYTNICIHIHIYNVVTWQTPFDVCTPGP